MSGGVYESKSDEIGVIEGVRRIKPVWPKVKFKLLIGLYFEKLKITYMPVSYTHLTLPTNREV